MSDPAILQPKLEGQRIIVHPIKPEDFAELYSLAYDPSAGNNTPRRSAIWSPNSERSSMARYTVAADSASLIKPPAC